VFYELQVKWNINLLQLPGLCELYPVLFLTAQHLSPLLVLAFTTDRYVSVCHPFEQERFCSRRRPLATICVLTAIALAINAVQAYFWTYNYSNGDCGLRPEVRKVRFPSKRNARNASDCVWMETGLYSTQSLFTGSVVEK